MSNGMQDAELAAFDDDDDDDELLEFSGADDDDDDDELALEMAEDDDDDDDELGDEFAEDEEFLGALIGGAVPALARGIGSLFRGRRRRRRVRFRGVPNRGRAVIGRRGGATIMTRRGPVRATLRRRFVTPAELRKALAGVRRDISRTKVEVRRVDRNAIRRDSATRKRVGRLLAAQQQAHRKALRRQAKKLKAAESKLNKELDNVRQMSLLTSLLQKPPQIETIKVEDVTRDATDPMIITDIEVAEGDTKYHDSGPNLLPILLMSGGLSGGDSNQTLLLALAMSGGL